MVSDSSDRVLDKIQIHLRDGMLRDKKWTSYKRKLREFTYQVGCAKAHEDPKKNIAELRFFQSTQMPYVAKLQGDLQDQIRLNTQQREIITALVFRYLIENLPPNPYKLKTNATDRWQAFWKDMFIKQYKDSIGGHPIEGLINKGIVESRNGQYDITDHSSSGGKGLKYRTGRYLYSTLSTTIHEYEGGGEGGYIVGDDQWGPPIRAVLRALIPKNFITDKKAGNFGEVDWAAERDRYVDP